MERAYKQNNIMTLKHEKLTTILVTFIYIYYVQHVTYTGGLYTFYGEYHMQYHDALHTYKEVSFIALRVDAI